MQSEMKSKIIVRVIRDSSGCYKILGGLKGRLDYRTYKLAEREFYPTTEKETEHFIFKDEGQSFELE